MSTTIKLKGRVDEKRLIGKINLAPSASSGGPLQAKTVIPTHSEQSIAPDEDYYGLAVVKVMPVPKLPAAEAGIMEGMLTWGDFFESEVNISTSSELQEPTTGELLYYNHEQFPEIPAEVLENYSYILIMRSLTAIRIYASNSKAYYWEDGETSKLTIPESYVRYTLNSDHNIWVADSCGDSTNFNMHGDGNWAVWWSNYDIPSGSVDSEEVYWYASVAQAEQPEVATHCYFNGVKLPAPPADVLAQYPYCFIRNNTTSGYYEMYCSVGVVFYSSDSNLQFGNDTARKRYRIAIASAESATEWEDNGTSTASVGIDSDRTALWSSRDIPNGSATATSVYYYGTPAVPNPV